jgi:hypothetical protein
MPRSTWTPLPTYTPEPTYTPFPTLTPRPFLTPTYPVPDSYLTATFTPNPSTLITPPALPIGGGGTDSVGAGLIFLLGLGLLIVGEIFSLRVGRK